MPDTHTKYLGVKFKLKCATEGFKHEHIAILERYGCWLDALASGDLHPTTSAQEGFMLICKGEAHPSTEYEQAWFAYRVQCLYEEAVRLCSSPYREKEAYTDFLVDAFYKVACLGHQGAIDWLQDIKKITRAPDLIFSDLGSLGVSFDPRSGQDLEWMRPRPRYGGWKTPMSSSLEDWSESFDDMGPEDWE